MQRRKLFTRPHQLLLSRFFSQGLIAAVLVTLLTGLVLTRLERENYIRYATETAQERVARVAERIGRQAQGMVMPAENEAERDRMQSRMAQANPLQRLIETEMQYGSMAMLEVSDASGEVIAASAPERLGQPSNLEAASQAVAGGQTVTSLIETDTGAYLRYAAPIQIGAEEYVVVVDEPLAQMQSALQKSARTVTAILALGFALTFAIQSLIVRRAGLEIEHHQREEGRVKDLLGRYVSYQVAQQILDHGGLTTDGERRQITVLFADIRGFTPFSEALPPEQVVVLLNDFLEAMTEVVFRHDGTLDKFLGDGLMVIFGAPANLKNDVDRALACAAEMQTRFCELKEQWGHLAGAAELQLGIGVNTGDAIVGSIGSARRLDYTAIGDVVNTAARLESIAEGGQTLISEATWQRMAEKELARSLGPRQLKGKREAISVFTLAQAAA